MQRLRDTLIRQGCDPSAAEGRVQLLRLTVSEFAREGSADSQTPALEGDEPDRAESFVRLSCGEVFTFRAAEWPVLAYVVDVSGGDDHGSHLGASELCSIQVRRSDCGHLVFGHRSTADSYASTGLKVDVFMTDLLIAIRDVVHELGCPRLLERILDALPREEWTGIARVEGDGGAVTVCRYVDGRHVVYGCISERSGDRSAFRVSGPMNFRLQEDVRLLTAELGLAHLAQQLIAQLH